MTRRTPLATAILFMAAASAAIAASGLVAKGLGGGWGGPLHPVQVTAGRFWGALPILLLLAARLPPDRRPILHRVPWRLHVARTCCGGTGAALMFSAVAQMPLGEATALSFLSPLVTMALAVPLLGDRIAARQLLAAAISVSSGCWFFCDPGPRRCSPQAFLALGAAALFGLESIFIKQLADREAPLRMLLVNNALGALIVIPFAYAVWTPPTGAEAGLMALVGVAMVTGQACYIQALRRGRVSAVSPAFYLALVFAALYDAAAFGVIPDGVAMAGAGLIVGGAALLATAGRSGGGAEPGLAASPARGGPPAPPRR